LTFTQLLAVGQNQLVQKKFMFNVWLAVAVAVMVASRLLELQFLAVLVVGLEVFPVQQSTHRNLQMQVIR
jgi:small basic protein